MDKLIYLVPAMGIIGLLYTFIKYAWVSKQDAGTSRMQEISKYIAEGAMAFLKAVWDILSYFVVIAALLMTFMRTRNYNSHWFIAVSFIIVAFSSAPSGYLGICIDTNTTLRTVRGDLP